MATHLIKLNTEHAQLLEAFLVDFDSAPEELHGYFCRRDWPIARVVKTLDDLAAGRNLQDGWVPCTTLFWQDGDTLLGVVNIRHHLTPALRQTGGHVGYSIVPSHRGRGLAKPMLAAALSACRDLGIERALLTCDATNEPSWRTIESNGGVLEKEAWDDTNDRMQRSYWIELSD